MIRTPLTSTKSRWETLLGRDNQEGEWTRILAYPQKISRNTRLKYIQFNYIHKTYLTSRITKMYGEEVP